MKRTLIAAITAFGLAIGMSGPAGASIILDSWTFDFSGVDGLPAGTVINNVQQITFTGIAHAEINDANGNLLPDVGETGIIDGHLAATQFVNNSGQVILGSGVNSTYEMTFAFSLDTLITDLTGTTSSFTHLGPQLPATGWLDMYINSVANITAGPDLQAIAGTGDGYRDGELIARFLVLPGEGGNYDVELGDGTDDATFELFWAMPGVFLDGPGGDDLADLGQLLIAITDSNFDGDPTATGPFSIATPTNWANYFPGRTGAGSPISFFALEDGSARLGVVPEPGTMLLLGTGLLGVAAYGRKRTRLS